MYHSVDLNHFQTQTQTQSLKLSFTDFDSGHKELFVFYHWNLLKGSRFWYRLCRVFVLVFVVARVSVWFRGDRARNEMRTKKWKREEGEGKKASLFLSSPLPPRSFACAIFRAVFDSRSSFFAPKPHRNACYACYLVGSPGGPGGEVLPTEWKAFFPTMAKLCTWI